MIPGECSGWLCYYQEDIFVDVNYLWLFMTFIVIDVYTEYNYMTANKRNFVKIPT